MRHVLQLSALLAMLISLFPPSDSIADVIVLKNGRRIVAESVTEAEDKVFYEGEGGTVSLPKSLIERIEPGAVGPGGASVPRASMAVKPVPDSPLAQEVIGEIRLPRSDAEGIIGSGAVDEERLRAIASLADRGALERQNAVSAYLLASSFEARLHRLGEASRWAEEALRLSGRDLNALLLAAQLDIAQQRNREALQHLLVAESMAPESPDVLALLGYAYYFTDGAERGLRYWKRAYALRPDQRLQRRILQVEREAAVETGFEQAQSFQFVLNWEGSQVSSSFSRDILNILERQYRELEIALDYSPRDPIVVVLYGSQQFADITQARGWVGALNDGKIRVPVQGLTSMTEDLARVLKHEMVHSFVHRMAGGRCPTWLNEGLAQLESGDTLSRGGPILAQLYSQSRQIPLNRLEGSWMQFTSSVAAIAYEEALAAAEMIRERHGAYQIPPLVKALGAGNTMAGALQQVLRTNYEELESELADFLASRYGR